jgi:hypothetical protein
MSKLNKDSIVEILRAEMANSIGFDGDDSSNELQTSRENALLYYKGDMSRDMPVIEGRSTAVSTDVADNIEAVLPQLVEIFLEEDVCSFQPNSEEDIAKAQQETDYINHVVYKQNQGFKTFNTVFKDALQIGTGVFSWRWEEAQQADNQTLEGLSSLDLDNLRQSVEQDRIVSVEEYQDPMSPTGVSYNVAVKAPFKDGKVVIEPFPADDLSVSKDTVRLGDGTYCALRSRVRRQQLIADGFDKAKVMDIPSYTTQNEMVNDARDLAGENEHMDDGSSIAGMDTVEIIHNYLRVVDRDGSKIICVVTAGDDMEHVLSMEEVTRVPASAICPFPQTHRFYGQSMADKLIQVQKINTSLLRMGLDSGSYSMNQRMEVVEGGAGKHTLSDLFRNTPGSPIRVKQAGTVVPVSAGALSFPVLEMIEHMKVVAETRSGVMRASQGLSPDTLHETKGGMLALMNSSQTRIRYMARNFAETGVKDMFLGVHEMLREHASVEQMVRLRGKWVPIDPTTWGIREDMQAEIGNAGGREWDVQALTQILDLQKQGMEAQGGPDGAFTSPKYILNTAHKLVSRMGMRSPEVFFPEPEAYQPQPQGQQGPSPEEQQMQMEMQMKQAEFQQKMQLEQQKMQLDMQAQQAKLQSEHSLKMEQMQAQMNLEREMAEQRMQLDREKMSAEMAMKQQQLDAELQLNMAVKQAEINQEEYKIQQGEDSNLRDGPSVGGDATV